MEDIKELYVKACVAYDGSNSYNIGWRHTYSKIFSEDISRKVFKLINLDYVDPDMDYEDDVKAFMNAFDYYMQESCSANQFYELQSKIVAECIEEYAPFDLKK